MGDAAMGMADGSDPHYLRLEAVRHFVDQYNINENTSFEIMLWNLDVIDVTMAMGPGGQMMPGFTKDPDELNRVLDNAHVDSMTDYLGTLDAIYHDIEQDILNTEDEANLVRTKYVVVFLSDGMSNVGDGPQSDIEIWARVEDLYEMVTERGVGGLNFHTFLLTELFGPGPMDQYVQGLCETTLRGMSDRGNGQFRIFETAESIDFINIVDGDLQAFEDMLPCLRLIEIKLCAAGDYLVTMVHEMLEHLLEIQHFRFTIHQSQHDCPEGGLHRRPLVQLVQHHIRAVSYTHLTLPTICSV